jgi:hypothetical protein
MIAQVTARFSRLIVSKPRQINAKTGESLTPQFKGKSKQGQRKIQSVFAFVPILQAGSCLRLCKVIVKA